VQSIRRNKLEAAGWRLGDAKDFLGLADHESAYVEVKVALAHALRARRAAAGLTQLELAQRIGSSQSRVAKMESGDSSVSLDRLVRALLHLGASRKEVGREVARVG